MSYKKKGSSSSRNSSSRSDGYCYKDFLFHKIIGTGSFGVVYQAEYIASSSSLPSSPLSSPKSPIIKRGSSSPKKKISENMVAIKVLQFNDNDTSNINNEIELLKALNSPFIVSFHGNFLHKGNLYMIFELCDGGSLEEYIKVSSGTLHEKEIKGIVAFTLLGLNHLHNHNTGLSYIHRDIKSANILLLKNGRSKLADLGITAELTSSRRLRKTVIGTPYWMAPELISEVGYDVPVDVWSLGIVILEMTNGKVPHDNINPMRAIFKIVSSPAPGLMKPEQWSDDLKDFLSLCLVKEPESRGTVKDLLEHPWLVEELEHITFLLGATDGLPSIKSLVKRKNNEVLAYREQALMDDNVDILNITTAIKSNDDDDLFLKLSYNNNSNLGFTWQNIETIRASFKKREPLLSTNSDILYDNHNRDNGNISSVEDYDNIDNSNSLLKTRIKNINEISPIKDGNNIMTALKYFQDTNDNSLEEELQALEKSYEDDLKALQLSYSKKKIELLAKYKHL